MERLQKVIAKSGYCSRRNAEVLIVEGKVKVNGKVVTELGTKVAKIDVVTVEGNLIVSETLVYYLLYKPKGYLSSTKPENNKPTVLDLFEDVEERIYPVGRLDYNTSGLLLLTNDGEFANLLMHPRYKIPKTYVVRCKGKLSGVDIFKLENGITIDGVKTKRAKVKVKKYDRTKNVSIVDITIFEGKNQQIRKMFLNIGHGVRQLKRTNYANLDLNDLSTGQYRKLTPHEVKQLYQLLKTGNK